VSQRRGGCAGDSDDTGTSITFLADADIFEDVNYDFDMACQRLKELAYLNKGVEIAIIDRGTTRRRRSTSMEE
jgi:DNA gyrase subunit B